MVIDQESAIAGKMRDSAAAAAIAVAAMPVQLAIQNEKATRNPAVRPKTVSI
jgi:hypothetical protein